MCACVLNLTEQTTNSFVSSLSVTHSSTRRHNTILLILHGIKCFPCGTAGDLIPERFPKIDTGVEEDEEEQWQQQGAECGISCPAPSLKSFSCSCQHDDSAEWLVKGPNWWIRRNVLCWRNGPSIGNAFFFFLRLWVGTKKLTLRCWRWNRLPST